MSAHRFQSIPTDSELLSRRAFLGCTAATAGALLLGTLPQRSVSAGAREEKLGVLPFVGEGRVAVGKLLGSGLSGRLALDLSRLTPRNLVTPNEQFYIRTRRPDRLDRVKKTPWTIRVGGLVRAPAEIALTDLRKFGRPQGVHLAECSGNSSRRGLGLMSAARWDGAPMVDVLEKVALDRRATRVLIAGFDEHSVSASDSVPGASWVFTFEELEATGAFLATRMNGVALPQDHGFPVRLVVPGWYGCCWAKWVDRIELVDDTVPATAQMREYAGRTHQDGVPRLARDFQPARIDQAAMAVRVEKWRIDSEIVHRVVGILWGGERPTDRLTVQFQHGASEASPFVPVESYEHRTNATWTLWTHTWRPPSVGRYRIRLRIADPGIRTRRLDRDFYTRTIQVDAV